jgi:hypothetical protein
VALTVGSSRTKSDIWIYDLVRETLTRLTFNEASRYPLWTRDGKRIAFMLSNFPTKSAVYWKAADGTGRDDGLIPEQDLRLMPWSWSSDVKTLVLTEFTLSEGLRFGIDALPLEGDRKLRLLLKEKYNQLQPQISPDGRWIAYVSVESGKPEVYVRPFPEVNKGKWQVSTSGGNQPLWSPNGRELFYHNADSVMAVAVEAGQMFKCGKPESLFRGSYTSFYDQDEHTWGISLDGRRFLMMKEPGSTASAGGAPLKINIVLNWFEELKQRVPAK